MRTLEILNLLNRSSRKYVRLSYLLSTPRRFCSNLAEIVRDRCGGTQVACLWRVTLSLDL